MKDLVLMWQLSAPQLLLLAAVAVAFLLLLIMKFRVHAFIALMVVSILTALAAGIPPHRMSEALSSGFNSTIGSVALLVSLGAMLGRMLEISGGAQVLTDALIKRFGEQRAPLALGVASLLMGFPIFFDAGLVVMLPIIFATARRAGGSLLRYAMPSVIAFSAMHVFVPPHPGAVAASGLLGANVGLVMVLGLLVALPVWYLVGMVFGRYVANKYQIAVPEFLHKGSDELKEFASNPRLGVVVLLLLLPFMLIAFNTGLNMYASTTADSKAFLAQPLVGVLRFVGETPIALLLSVLVGMLLLGWHSGKPAKLVEKVLDSALAPIFSVILITGAGGMFGGVLRATGIGNAVADSFQHMGLPIIVAGFLISCLVRVAQGSATVALITTAALVQPAVMGNLDYNGVQVAAIVLALAAGSVFASHVNDSGFWLVSRFFNLDMKTTLKTWTVAQALMAVIGFIGAYAIYLLAS